MLEGKALHAGELSHVAGRSGVHLAERLVDCGDYHVLEHLNVLRVNCLRVYREARQLVNHGHYTVNGKRVNIPSYLVKTGDVIAVSEKSCSNNRFKKLKEDDAFVAAPKWLDRDKNTLTGKVLALPARDDIDFEIAEHLIVELYSK